MTQNKEIRKVQRELLDWLQHQPESISAIATTVSIGLSNAIRFGGHPTTLCLLAGDVARLASAASDEDKSRR